MKQIKIKYILFASIVFLLANVSLAGNKGMVDVKLTLVDSTGVPVQGAQVFIDEGKTILISNESGVVSGKSFKDDAILIKAKGYKSIVLQAAKLPSDRKVLMKKLPFLMTEDDDVNLPFGTLKKKLVTGAVSVIDVDEINNYDAKTSVTSILNGRVAGMFGGDDVRGIGAIYVVDGIVRPLGTLTIEEVEQVTVLKDVASRMLYGAQANMPVIMVTTKRGKAYQRKFKVNTEFGIQNPISLPEYLDAASYMELYNEALENDGKAVQYSQEDIDNTRNGVDPVRYPDQDYYNNTYLKDRKNYQRVYVEGSGGNKSAQYYANLNYKHSNGLMAVGPDNGSDLINLRGNVNYNITDDLKMTFDGVALMNIDRSENGDFWTNSTLYRPNEFPLLIPASRLTDETMIGSAQLIDGEYVLGGTDKFNAGEQTNIYGDLMKGGYQTNYDRLLQFNTGLDFDMNFITKGLSAKAFLSFDLHNYYKNQQLNTYASYREFVGSDVNGNDSIYFEKYGEDKKAGYESITQSSFYRRVGFYGQLNYKRNFGLHGVDAKAIAYRDQYSWQGAMQTSKNLNFGFNVNYNYNTRYIVELSGTMAGSPRFAHEHRYAFSPAIAGAWVLSEEDFLSSVSAIDYLKLRGSFGIIATDMGINDYYLYMSTYEQGGWFNYNNGVNRNRVRNITVIGNSDLLWPKRQEINVGFEAMLMKSIQLEAAYFNSVFKDEIIKRVNAYSSLLPVLPWENYNSDKVSGVEFGLNFKKVVGNLELESGVNMVYTTPEVLLYDEPNYNYDYRFQEGQRTDAYFGYVAEGLFESQTEIDSHADQSGFGGVRQPGDIKYKDLNDDGVINADDQEVIGNSHAKMAYGVNLRVKFKSVELFMLGTGQNGGYRYFNNDYFQPYGDVKYSVEALNRWTQATSYSATLPRLSSISNNNNQVNSSYWLYENNWFNLSTVQLTYYLPENIAKKAFLKGLNVYGRVNNLLMVSKNKEKGELNIGSEPQYRLFSLGLRASF